MSKFSENLKLKECQISPEKSVEEGQINLLVELLELTLHHHIALAVSSLPHILYMSQVTSLKPQASTLQAYLYLYFI
jgi:hypothetical protein